MGIILAMVGVITFCVCVAVGGVVFLVGFADEIIASEDETEPPGW